MFIVQELSAYSAHIVLLNLPELLIYRGTEDKDLPSVSLDKDKGKGERKAIDGASTVSMYIR